MSQIAVNVRNIHAPLTGVQRYTREILARIQGAVDEIDPGPLPGVRGHAWEQFALPLKLHGRLLWSPGNTGPLAVERQVVTIHDVSTFDVPGAMQPRFTRWYQFLLPRLARRACRVITVSNFAKDRIVARLGVDPARISVIFNGVDHQIYCPQADDRICALLAPIFPGRNYVLSVFSSLAPHKNPLALFKAWTIARPQLPPDFFLVVVGDFADRGIFNLPDFPGDAAERIWLAGHRNDAELAALYSGAAAFVYPSIYDSFGLPVLEAMACGAPVIVNRAAALPEVAGDAALYVDATDPQAIAAAIIRTVSDTAIAADLRSRSLERAAYFDWAETARQTLEALRGCVTK